MQVCSQQTHMATLLILQRVLNSENADYANVYAGVTTHYLTIQHGETKLQRAVGALHDYGFVDISKPTAGMSSEARKAVLDMEEEIVAAVSQRDADPAAEALEVKGFRSSVRTSVPVVDKLDSRAYHRLLASRTHRPMGPEHNRTLVIQWHDDNRFETEVASYLDSMGIDVAEDDDDDDDGEDDDAYDEEAEEDGKATTGPLKRRREW